MLAKVPFRRYSPKYLIFSTPKYGNYILISEIISFWEVKFPPNGEFLGKRREHFQGHGTLAEQ
jgi:hypothetical protein